MPMPMSMPMRLLCMLTLGLYGLAHGSLAIAEPVSNEYALVSHWAPVWYQDTDTRDKQADFIVGLDYDFALTKNLRPDDNWENLHRQGVLSQIRAAGERAGAVLGRSAAR